MYCWVLVLMALKPLASVQWLQRGHLTQMILRACSGDNVSASPLSGLVVLEYYAAVEYQNMTELRVGPPLPPTFEIEISKACPLPSSSPPGTLCDGFTEAASNTDGCHGSLANSTRKNGRLLLISNQTGAVLSLHPVAVDPDITSSQQCLRRQGEEKRLADLIWFSCKKRCGQRLTINVLHLFNGQDLYMSKKCPC